MGFMLSTGNRWLVTSAQVNVVTLGMPWEDEAVPAIKYEWPSVYDCITEDSRGAQCMSGD